MDRRIYLVVVSAFVLFNCENIALGQNSRKLSEQVTFLNESTRNRNFEELIDAISRDDDGNFDVIMAASVDSASFQQVRSRFKGTVNDPRVRKLYELTMKMTKEQAATTIENAFREKLKEYESIGGSLSKQHGLHSTLFLASEFCSQNSFNQLFSEWVDWSRGQLIDDKYKKRYENVQNQFQLRNLAVKSLFYESNGPELLMTANLILNCQIRQGKTTKEAIETIADAFAKAGWSDKLPIVVSQDLVPHEASEANVPLTSVYSFASWGELGGADIDLQIKLIDAARDCLDPP